MWHRRGMRPCRCPCPAASQQPAPSSPLQSAELRATSTRPLQRARQAFWYHSPSAPHTGWFEKVQPCAQSAPPTGRGGRAAAAASAGAAARSRATAQATEAARDRTGCFMLHRRPALAGVSCVSRAEAVLRGQSHNARPQRSISAVYESICSSRASRPARHRCCNACQALALGTRVCVNVWNKRCSWVNTLNEWRSLPMLEAFAAPAFETR